MTVDIYNFIILTFWRKNMDVAAVILAAGKGVRMKSEKPKVFHEICGKPMLSYVLDTVFDLGLKEIFVVLGHKSEIIRQFYDRLPITFVEQREQLGTAHAVMQVEAELKSYKGTILVLNGDMPLLKGDTLRRFIGEHTSSKAKATVLTAEMDDPGNFGRVVRGAEGEIIRIVEKKDANDMELNIKEINTGTYCFEPDVLFSALKEIKPINVQKEYYLTDCIALFRNKGYKVSSVKLHNSLEAIGVNTKEELELVQRILLQQTT